MQYSYNFDKIITDRFTLTHFKENYDWERFYELAFFYLYDFFKLNSDLDSHYTYSFRWDNNVPIVVMIGQKGNSVSKMDSELENINEKLLKIYHSKYESLTPNEAKSISEKIKEDKRLEKLIKEYSIVKTKYQDKLTLTQTELESVFTSTVMYFRNKNASVLDSQLVLSLL